MRPFHREEHKGIGLVEDSLLAAYSAMPDEPKKIFDLMDTETEPTDEQLAELMHLVGEDIRAESARIRRRTGANVAHVMAEKPASYGPSKSS